MSDSTRHSAPMLSVHEVADLFAVSSCTIRRWTAAEVFPPPVRVGPRLRRWDRLAIEGWASLHGPGPRVLGVDE